MIRCQVGIKTLRLRLYGMRRAQGHGPTEPVAGRGREASCRELEKVSRCSQQFDLVSSGTEVGFGARLARERTRFTITERGYSPQFDQTVDCGVSGGTTSPTDHKCGDLESPLVRGERTEGNLMTRLESRTKSFFFFSFFLS
jgi:hypothetical protein